MLVCRLRNRCALDADRSFFFVHSIPVVYEIARSDGRS